MWIAGCAAPLESAVTASNTTRAALETSYDVVLAAQRAHLDAELELSRDAAEAQQKLGAVHAAYAPVWKVYRRARLAWVVAAASIQAAEVAQSAGGTPDVAGVLRDMAKLAGAMAQFRAAVAELNEGDR